MVTTEVQHIGLVCQRQVLAFGGAGQVEGIAHGALDTHTGVDRTLRGDFVGRALADDAALAGVGAFGVLANDGHVDVVFGGHERALVDVEIEFEAHLQQQAPLDNTGRNAGRADRTDVQGIKAAPFLQRGVAEHFAVSQVAGATEVIVDGFELHASRFNDFETFSNDLRPNAVATQNPNFVCHCCLLLPL